MYKQYVISVLKSPKGGWFGEAEHFQNPDDLIEVEGKRSKREAVQALQGLIDTRQKQKEV